MLDAKDYCYEGKVDASGVSESGRYPVVLSGQSLKLFKENERKNSVWS